MVKTATDRGLNYFLKTKISGWADLNRRPPEPHSGALPGCATSRYSFDMLA